MDSRIESRIKEELDSFLERVQSIYDESGVNSQLKRETLTEKFMGSIVPSVNSTDPLQNFLASTLNNSHQKRNRQNFFNRDFTQISNEKILNFNDKISSNFYQSSKDNFFSNNFNQIPLNSNNSLSSNRLFNFPSVAFDRFDQKMRSFSQNNHNIIVKSEYSSFIDQQIDKIPRSYSSDQKQEIVNYSRVYGLRLAGEKYQIQPHKIKQWAKIMQKEKQTRGRKPVDPNMELNVCEWLEYELTKGAHITQKNIRDKAKQFSNSNEFKASKGWLEKFFRRRPLLFDLYTQNRTNIDLKKQAQALLGFKSTMTKDIEAKASNIKEEK